MVNDEERGQNVQSEDGWNQMRFCLLGSYTYDTLWYTLSKNGQRQMGSWYLSLPLARFRNYLLELCILFQRIFAERQLVSYSSWDFIYLAVKYNSGSEIFKVWYFFRWWIYLNCDVKAFNYKMRVSHIYIDLKITFRCCL